MAKTNEGIIGGITGTIGPVTGYVKYGQQILRTSKSNVKFKYTASRKTQLEKIKLCNAFTTAFSRSGFLNKSFAAYGAKNSGYNRCTSALLNQAIISVDGVLQLSYPQVLVSKGLLPKAVNASAVLLPGDNIQFTFGDNSGTGTALANDSVILVAYCEVLLQAVFTLNAGFRKDETAVLNVSSLNGCTVETWIGFLNVDATNASDSVWTGRVGL